MSFARKTSLRGSLLVFLLGLIFIAVLANVADAQSKKVRVAVPGYTIAVLSFLAR